MIIFDVCYDSDVRAQLQEGPVAFIRLGDEITPRSELRIRTQIRYLAADDDRRGNTGTVQCHADHGSGRGLAVRPGDRNAVICIDERRIDIRAVKLGNAQIPCRDHLYIIVGDRRGDDDGIRAAHILGMLSVRPDACAEANEFLDDGRRALIRTGYLITEQEKNLRQRTHPCAADADKMDRVDPL